VHANLQFPALVSFGADKYPAAFEDAQAAVKWVHDNAQKYRFDATRISSVGSSAGGHLASLLGTSGKGTAAVNAVVAFNPVLDLTDTTRGEDGNIKFLGGLCAEHLAACKEASPVLQVHRNMPPFLILHGTADENVPFPQAVHMVQALKAAGDSVDFFQADGGKHTFWSTPQWYAPTEKAMETFLLKVFQPMPVAQQNALVQKYCAGCHQDKPNNFGLSLAGFDAAHPDPTVAAMLAAKLQGGAIGAAGIPRPGRAAEDALLTALTSEAAGAANWNVTQTAAPNPTLTASALQRLPSPRVPGEMDLYRLTLTCDTDSRKAAMQVTWAPGDVETARPMSISADGKAQSPYTVQSGEGVAYLDATKVGLPSQSLTVSGLVYGETAVFPFVNMDRNVRQTLAKCF
jgi:dienelactone hydrolase